MRIKGLISVIVLMLGSAAQMASHDGLRAAILQVTEQLRREPRNAALYLQRGELLRLHGEWRAALRDYDRAARLSPGLAEADLGRAKSLLSLGKPAAAKRALDRLLWRVPGNADALTSRAQAWLALHRPSEAAADFSRAISSSSEPTPDLYLARTNAQVAAGILQAAVAGLDEGVHRLGPIVSLQQRAIELECRLRRYDAALARLETLEPQFARKEHWLVWRASIMEQAGRREAARESYAAALTQLERLPSSRRAAPATRELESRIVQALAHPR